MPEELLSGSENQRWEKVLDDFRAHKTVLGKWDLDREKPSLGGLLLLRSELELLAAICDVKRIKIVFRSRSLESPEISTGLFREVMQSRYQIEIADQYSGPSWPSDFPEMSADSSYQHFDRCTSLYLATNIRPSLAWDAAVNERAGDQNQKFSGKLFTAHLKNVAGACREESNADPRHWAEFLKATALPGKRDFMLLGADQIPDEISAIEGVHVAARLGIPLSDQLALIGLSDGFIGMASGVCAAAILSKVPYVLFKHPAHHPEEMQRQVGSDEAFQFAIKRQKIWRIDHTPDELARAFNIICGQE